MIGKTISHYQIIEEIGSGGMGIVYKAEDTKLKRVVALKFLPPEFTRDKEAKKRFIHEAQAAAALDHPNICTVHEINETDDGRLFIVMPYYEGETLKDKITSGPLSLSDAVDMVIQIAEGLNKAHKKGIVHRDIKTANIIIQEGIPKILDFGLAKLRGQTKLTKESTTLGTVAYMSPEQTTGEEVDQRTDIWSLGVVFYEMLTGQLPFRGHYEQAIMYSIMNEEPQPLKELIPDVPEQMEKIINMMLVKDPARRYPNLGDFIEDLKRIKKGKELKEISVKPRAKISSSYLVLGIIFLVAIIIAAYFLFKGKTRPEISPSRPESMPSLAVVYFENKSGDENLDNWREAFSELLTTDLSQSKYIKVLRSDEVYGIFKRLNLLEAKRYSTQDLQNIAEKGKVNHILRGSYFKDEDNFVITTMLLKADTGETISSLSVRAKKGGIFANIDGITREIKSKLNISEEQISGDIDKSIDQITTSSLEAYQYYLQGRRYFSAGDYRKSITFMEKAIDIDPEFAMAYRSMAFAHGMLWEVSKWNEYMKKALELGHRLSDRERYIIEGDFYRFDEKTWDKAINAFNKALELYPYDLNINVSSAELYFDLGEFEKSIERYETAIQNKPESFVPYNNLSYGYGATGQFEKARKILEYYLKHFQDHFRIRIALTRLYCIQSKFELALAEAEKAITLMPKNYETHIMKGDVYFYKGNFNEAEKIYHKLLEFKEPIARREALDSIGAVYLTQGRLKHAKNQFKQALKLEKIKAREDIQLLFIAIINFIQGNYDKCLEELKKIMAWLENWPQLHDWPLYMMALTYLEKNSMVQTQKAEAELLEWANNRKNKEKIGLYYLFRGQKEWKQKNLSGAIEYLNKALSIWVYSFWPQARKAWVVDPLARVYLESGNIEKAQELFEEIVSLSTARRLTGDVYAKAFYELGKIYQQRGLKQKAINSFNKFIELWKNCDPIFQSMVEDATKRVKELVPSQD